MKDKYRACKATVSFVRYHIVFCPRYRRAVFSVPGVEERFRELLEAECRKREISLIKTECQTDYVYLIVSILPEMSIKEAVRYMKSATTPLITEFSQFSAMPNLWTRGYFVSTEDRITDGTIKWYVETQKTRD